MTSKEALENVKIAPSFMGGNPRYWAYSESSIPFLEDINTIKKDLEVLEILKDVFNYKSVQQFVDHMSREDFFKVQEWLEK